MDISDDDQKNTLDSVSSSAAPAPPKTHSYLKDFKKKCRKANSIISSNKNQTTTQIQQSSSQSMDLIPDLEKTLDKTTISCSGTANDHSEDEENNTPPSNSRGKVRRISTTQQIQPVTISEKCAELNTKMLVQSIRQMGGVMTQFFENQEHQKAVDQVV